MPAAKEKTFGVVARVTALLLLLAALTASAQASSAPENPVWQKSAPNTESLLSQPLQLLEPHQVKARLRWYDASDYAFATDANGMTNMQRMQRGRPPIGYDGEPVNLHHLIQMEPGPMAEVGGAFHARYTKILHGLVEDRASFRYSSDGKLTEAEKAFNRWSYHYWKERAKGF